MIRHVIAIPTFRRPEAIARALDAVLNQIDSLPEGELAELFVIDNDPEESGRDVVAARGVRYVVEHAPGIAAVRNRALDDNRDATTVIFLDDDEAAAPGWLAELTAVYRELSPTAVAGRVITLFPEDTEEWVRKSGAFIRPRRIDRQVMSEAATNNLLLDAAQVRELGLRFDEQFGLTGGSDSMFTRQLTRAGGTIRWAEHAVVVEQEERARFTRGWVLMRSFRFGNSAGRVALELETVRRRRILARGVYLGRGFVRLGGGSGRWVLGVVINSLEHRARGVRTAYRGAGMIAAAVGYAHDEYGRRRRAAAE